MSDDKENFVIYFAIRVSLVLVIFILGYAIFLANYLGVKQITVDFFDVIYDEIKFMVTLCSIFWFIVEIDSFLKKQKFINVLVKHFIVGTLILVGVGYYHVNFYPNRFSPYNYMDVSIADTIGISPKSQLSPGLSLNETLILKRMEKGFENPHKKNSNNILTENFIEVLSENKEKEMVILFYEIILLSIFKENNGVTLNSIEQELLVNHSKKLTKIALEEKWEDFEHFLDNIDDLSEHVIIDMALTIATMTRAPIELIAKFTNSGGKIPLQSLLMLLESNDVEYFQALENMGANFDLFTQRNMNPVDAALIVPTSQVMFDYLLLQSSDLSMKNDFGLDSLGVAIVNSPANLYSNNQFISKLIARGATVKEDHLLFMKKIKDENVFLYEEMVAMNPQLRI